MSLKANEHFILAPHYESQRDITSESFQQIRKYVQATPFASKHFQRLSSILLASQRKDTLAEKLLPLSTKHHLEIFKEIINSIERPSKEVKQTLDVIGFEQILQLHCKMSAGDTLDEGRLELKNVSSKESGSPSAGYQKLVLYLTPYELSAKFMIERFEIVREAIAPQKRFGEIIEQLKNIFETEDRGTYLGYSRTVALCTGVNETRQMSIATSKDV